MTPRPTAQTSLRALAIGKRDTTPDVSAADVRAVVRGDTDFAFDLYQRLRRSERGNVVIGPYSISVAFAMQHAGARGRTASQMERVLHLTIPTHRLDAAFDRLSLDLESRQHRRLTLAIANRLFGDETLGDLAVPFRRAYLREVTRYFAAPLATVDFSERPEVARKLINAWVADQTAGRIKELIPRQQLTKDTVMVLVNAIYLNARWATPFRSQNTFDQRFFRLDGTRIKVPTMHQLDTFPAVETDDYVAAELPYQGDDLSMVVVMPRKGTFAAFEHSLDRSFLNGVLRGLRNQLTSVALPRFSIRSRFELGATLQRMGMKDAFDKDEADLYDMTTVPPGELPRLYIAKVFHQGWIKVTERGTEASAATAIIDEGAGGGPPDYVEATFDHPFVWFILDRQTGTILFMGRVVDPSITA